MTSEKQQITLEILEKELDNEGFSVRYNVKEKRYEAMASLPKISYSFDEVITVMKPKLKNKYKGISYLNKYLEFIARENQYNS